MYITVLSFSSGHVYRINIFIFINAREKIGWSESVNVIFFLNKHYFPEKTISSGQ